MALRWTKPQKEINQLITEGLPPREIKARGYKIELIRKVKKARAKGDIPGGIVPPGGEHPSKPGAEAPLFSATLKTKGMTLQPMVAVRYDSVRNALGFSDDYSLEQFIDDCTDLVTQLVGAVPPGFVKEEAKEEVMEAAAVQANKGGDNGGNQ